MSVGEGSSSTPPVHYGNSDADAPGHPLDCFFAPSAVAVIGASERPGSVGRTAFWNLISNPFGGAVYAVNPHHNRVLGIRTLPRLADVPEPVDLALIITKADTVPGVLDECIAAGVKGAIIFAAGFVERGESGRLLEAEIRGRACPGGLRIIGPNSLGIMCPVRGFNAAYAQRIALRGSVGFISQSGALCASILDWSFQVSVGFSAFVSFGAMADVGWSDMIYYLGNDPHTRSIVIYMESLGEARSFLSAAREVALTKPIIVLKTGQGAAGVRTAFDPACGISGETENDELLSAALLRSGVLRVNRVDTLFSMAEVLGKQPRPRGKRLTIISNAAGPAVLASDALMREGGDLAKLSKETIRSLDQVMPPYWNRGNPMDIIADADPERYVQAVKHAVADENSDGVLVMLAPQVTTDSTGTARAIARIENFGNKPVLASWMGGDAVLRGTEILNENRIPTFAYPDRAAEIFALMFRYSYALRGLYETPHVHPADNYDETKIAAVRHEAERLRQSGETFLPYPLAQQLLAAYGLPVAQMRTVNTEEDALDCAEELGYPVVLRLQSDVCEPGFMFPDPASAQINAREVRKHFRFLMETSGNEKRPMVTLRPYVRSEGVQLYLASHTDPQFGPYLVFGAGGHTSGFVRDYAYALPPLNSTLAKRTMERTRLFRALRSVENSGRVNEDLLQEILVRFSLLVVREPWIRSLELNPVLAGSRKVTILEARLLSFDAGIPADALPQPAIRPYPNEYCLSCGMKDGTNVLLRPIRPEDENLMVKFHRTLSSETVYFRYLRLLSLDQRIRHDQMSKMCFIDYDRQIALVAEYKEPVSGESSILAIGRLVKIHGTADADFALVVNDRAQGRGLGEVLLRHLLHVAESENIVRVTGIIHPENKGMIHLCRKVGFTLNKPPGDEIRAVYHIFSEGAH